MMRSQTERSFGRAQQKNRGTRAMKARRLSPRIMDSSSVGLSSRTTLARGTGRGNSGSGTGFGWAFTSAGALRGRTDSGASAPQYSQAFTWAVYGALQ